MDPVKVCQVVSGVSELRLALVGARRQGHKIALVPTMGALHAGHLALVRRAQQVAERVVVSIFVNPAQFGPGEDFDHYPRPLERDLAALREVGCDLVFLPEVEALYPPGSTTWVDCQGPSKGFEGAERPGHFRGVATVVSKFFHLVQPDVAIFGEKDAQQLAVIRSMVRDLQMPVEILGHPIVREPDGLALSSRNVYLSPEERQAALVLSRSLRVAKQLVDQGERLASRVIAAVRAELETAVRGDERRIDYVAVVDALSFEPIERLSGSCVLPIAFRLGRTRLLDNLQIQVGEDGSAVARL